MTTETIEPEVLLPAIIPVVELEKINATDAALAQLRAKALELQQTGTPHKAAYEEVHALTMVAVKVRTGAMDIAKVLATPHKEKYDAIMEEGKRIGQHAKESEAIVRPLKEAYETEQVRLKEEAAQAEAARLATRINNLHALGATFDGLTYDVYGVMIDAIEIKALPDDEWMDLYGSARKAYDVEMERLDAIQKEKEIEAARIAAEQKAESDRLAAVAKQQQEENQRLQAVADEQARQQAEFQKKQAAFEKQQRDAEKAADDERRRIYDEEAAKEMAAQKEKAYAEWQAEQLKMEQQAEADRIASEKAAKIEAAAKLKADKERTKRLAPEKKAILKYLNAFSCGNVGITLTQPETIDAFTSFMERLTKAVGESLTEVEAL